MNGGTYRFNLPRAGGTVWLNSRHFVAAEREAGSRDMRRLGVAVESIMLFDTDLVVEAWHGHPSLRDGFHTAETAHRWTDGHARIPDALLRPFPGALTLEVRLAGQETRSATELPRFNPPVERTLWRVAGTA